LIEFFPQCFAGHCADGTDSNDLRAFRAPAPFILNRDVRSFADNLLLNLARNAIEAMGTIKDESRVLRVSTRHGDHDAVTVTVEDTGPGIDQETLDRIFDAFFSTKHKGMGLGLAICRMIVERHGGQLTALSDGKRGTLFQFILPVRSAAGPIAASG
jgi:signal transduction histidine kinase